VAPNSPIEIAKLNNPAIIILGNNIGNSIFENAFNREAPRLIATFTVAESIFPLAAAIIRFAKGKAIRV